MSGQNVPYYLRPNKHVERQIFVEILSHIDRWASLGGYVYLSMGGKFLEDFKLMHSSLSIRKLLSIESDEITFQRQKFNRPLSLIDCRKMLSGDLVAQLDSLLEEKAATNCILWLDYTAPNKRLSQLQEVEMVSSKLASGDILKITFNASVWTLGNKSDYDNSTDKFQEAALEKVKQQLGVYFPSPAPKAKDMTRIGLPKIISQAAKTAILRGLLGDCDLSFLPLGEFRYNDGYHDMYTLTGIFLKTHEQAAFIEKTRFKEFIFLPTEWHSIIEINLPDLSFKERMVIDVDIYSDKPCDIHDRLPFKLHEDSEKSLEILKKYIEHHKRYPNFVQAVF